MGNIKRLMSVEQDEREFNCKNAVPKWKGVDAVDHGRSIVLKGARVEIDT